MYADLIVDIHHLRPPLRARTRRVERLSGGIVCFVCVGFTFEGFESFDGVADVRVEHVLGESFQRAPGFGVRGEPVGLAGAVRAFPLRRRAGRERLVAVGEERTSRGVVVQGKGVREGGERVQTRKMRKQRTRHASVLGERQVELGARCLGCLGCLGTRSLLALVLSGGVVLRPRAGNVLVLLGASFGRADVVVGGAHDELPSSSYFLPGRVFARTRSPAAKRGNRSATTRWMTRTREGCPCGSPGARSAPACDEKRPAERALFLPKLRICSVSLPGSRSVTPGSVPAREIGHPPIASRARALFRVYATYSKRLQSPPCLKSTRLAASRHSAPALAPRTSPASDVLRGRRASLPNPRPPRRVRPTRAPRAHHARVRVRKTNPF